MGGFHEVTSNAISLKSTSDISYHNLLSYYIRLLQTNNIYAILRQHKSHRVLQGIADLPPDKVIVPGSHGSPQ